MGVLEEAGRVRDRVSETWRVRVQESARQGSTRGGVQVCPLESLLLRILRSIELDKPFSMKCANTLAAVVQTNHSMSSSTHGSLWWYWVAMWRSNSCSRPVLTHPGSQTSTLETVA